MTDHFKPLWGRNVPKFGIAHAMALGVSRSTFKTFFFFFFFFILKSQSLQRLQRIFKIKTFLKNTKLFKELNLAERNG